MGVRLPCLMCSCVVQLTGSPLFWVVPAARVVQQLSHGDAQEARVHLRVRRRPDVADDPERRVVQAELPLLDQLERGHRRDALGQAGHAEERVRLHNYVGGDVGPTVAAGQDQLAVLGHSQGGAWNAVTAHHGNHGRVQRLQARAELARGRPCLFRGPERLLGTGGQRKAGEQC